MQYYSPEYLDYTLNKIPQEYHSQAPFFVSIMIFNESTSSTWLWYVGLNYKRKITLLQNLRT